MPVNIPDNLKEKYLDYFDETKAKIPSRDPKEYNVADDFFGNIEHSKNSLASLLQQIQRFPSPKEKLEQDVYAEFTVTAHAKVRKLPGQQENLKTIVGQNSMMLKKGEEGTDIAVKQSKYADPNDIVFTSDLPRAIHHALLKYKPELKDRLDSFANDVQAEIARTGGIIGKKKHLCLIEMALTNGIIPTPLLRSHYHGPRDGLPESPEDWDKFDVDAFLRSDLCKQYFEEESEIEIRQELKDLRTLGMTGRNPFQLVKGKDGKIFTENLPLYIFRIAYLAELFSPRGNSYDKEKRKFVPEGEFYEKINDKRLNFVGHSSNIDAISSYFRHFEKNKVVLEKADKSKTRGKELVIKVGEGFDEKGNKILIYLNDPQKLEPLKVKCWDQINYLRNLSIDDLIRRGKGIVEIPLLEFREKEKGSGKYEPYSEKIETALESQSPIVIFGHGGQGKTILAVKIAERFLNDVEFYNMYGNVIPILENCGELNKCLKPLLHSKSEDLRKNDKFIYNYLKNLATGGLHPLLLKEFKSAFIIDDYQKLNPDYTTAMDGAVRRLRSEGNIVIILSRMERTDVHPPHNPGYKTMQIDTEAIAKQNDEYIEGRIPLEHKERFKEYLKQYDSSVTGYYLTKLFLTMIFPTGNGENKGVLEYITEDSIAQVIREGKPLTRTQLYEAQTDYVTGHDIERKYGAGLGHEEMIHRIKEWKNILAEMAYQQVFGQPNKGK